MTGWRLLFWPVYTTILANEYLWLKESGTEMEVNATTSETCEIIEKIAEEKGQVKDEAKARAEELRNKFGLK